MGKATMTKHTPTAERIVAAVVGTHGVAYTELASSFRASLENEMLERVENILAAHDAEVAANALRDAVALIRSEEHEQWSRDARRIPCSQMVAQHMGMLATVLTNRADRIEREAGTNTTNPELGSSEGGHDA